ncbi:MAG TPA: urate hydroxylase PuuD [Gammaproteobacteria bacterium]|nr:urate hydroxylase PuuD [Gammaproteobacteria bacterium]
MNPLRSIGGTIGAGVVLAVVIGLVTMGVEFNVASFIVWLHVLGGIVWIGLLYYFNFVQAPALAAAAADAGGPGGSGITKYVAPRALAWFRWGAVFTWLTGAGYLGHMKILPDAFALGFLTGSAADRVIGVGAWLGTIMLFNVWVLIWPSQKKLLGMVEATADEIARARRTAFLASRVNTVLSVPLVMSMVGYGHGGFFI